MPEGCVPPSLKTHLAIVAEPRETKIGSARDIHMHGDQIVPRAPTLQETLL